MAFPLPSKLLSGCDDGLFYCFSNYVYTVVPMFWTLMLLGFCIVMFTATQNLGRTRAFGFSSIIGLLGAIFLTILNLMPWWIASIFIIVGAIGFAVLIISED